MRSLGRGLPSAAVLAGAAVLLALAGMLAGVLAAAISRSNASAAERAASAAPGGKRGLSVVWGGDTTLGSSMGLPPAAGWPQLEPVAATLGAADVAAVNLEGTFAPGGDSKCTVPSTSCFAFQAPPGNAATLARAGVDIVNTANNHAFDYGPLGWRGTRDALAAAKVAAVGAPGEVRLLERDGLRVAFVGFSTYPWSSPMSDDASVRMLVRAADAKADVVVCFLHAGAEGADRTHVPDGAEDAFGEDRGDSRRFARAAIDAGADLVLGSGPHVLRGMEVYKDRLAAYSLGNLAGWNNFGTGGTLSLSALLRVQLGPDGRFVRARVRSLLLDGTGIPHRDADGAAAAQMRQLSAEDFGDASPWAQGRMAPAGG
ncbi:MAG: CapA family protein [Solirubrobacteraceae bacterium]